MRVWRYCEPTSPTDNNPVWHTYTDAEILHEYFPHWSRAMKRVGREDKINEEDCIMDWVVVHWAAPIEEWGDDAKS